MNTLVSVVHSEVGEGTMHVCVDFSVPQITSIEKWMAAPYVCHFGAPVTHCVAIQGHPVVT